VGGPRNYKWINTNNIARVWEQMHLAYEYGVNKIWIVNVGDLKPMEMPISFFLDYAYNTKKWNEDNLANFFTQWASEQFGPAYSKQIGEVVKKYALYASRRKPELLDASTYSLTNYDEFDRVLNQWHQLRLQAEKIDQSLPAEYKDAYFELVLHPVQAFENLHQLYFAVAMNAKYASEKNILANKWADKAKQFYINDSLLSVKYNKEIAGGKWSHMMDQTHIGYRYWQEPRRNSMPQVTYVSTDSAKAIKASNLAETSENNISPKGEGVFVEKDGYVSMDAPHYSKAVNNSYIRWKIIRDIGKEGDGITTFPVTVSTQLNSSSPHVEYPFYCDSKDSLKLLTYFSPTLNFHHSPKGLQFAVSIDNETPQIVSLNKEDNGDIMNNWVANNIIIKTTEHFISKPGKHTLKYWMIDPGIILQKLVIDFGGLKRSYLGPPETIFKQKN
jgi:hypothetical protein